MVLCTFVTVNITDQHNRVHDYLRISLTEQCNLKCTYCRPAETIQWQDRANIMSYEEIIEIAKTFVKLGVKKIRLTGGEPLVRKEAEKILLKLGELPIELAITTNGVLVDRFIEIFKAAGSKAINLSLDTLKRERNQQITRRDHFDDIIENIHTLVKEGFKVKTNLVLVRGQNDDEILDFIEWTKDLNVQVRFIEFMPFDGNNWDWKNKGISYDELMTIIKGKYPNVIRLTDDENDTSKNYRIEGYQGSFAVISSVTEPFCGTCNRIRLTADGKIKNCLFSNEEADILGTLRRGESIEPVIHNIIQKKKAVRAGMEKFEDFSNKDLNSNNRSMISIGG